MCSAVSVKQEINQHVISDVFKIMTRLNCLSDRRKRKGAPAYPIKDSRLISVAISLWLPAVYS